MNSIDEFEPLADQVVVEPLRPLERFERTFGSLFVPDNPERDKQREFFHLGRVIKCGPGDAVREGSVRKDGSRAAYQCPPTKCTGCLDGFDVVYNQTCPKCQGTGTVHRWPMHVQAGDIVLYERRPTAVILLGGRQFLVLHEEQHIVCVVTGLKGELTAPPYDPKLAEVVPC